MKVQIESTGPYEKKMSVEVPADAVTREIESTYRALNRNVKIKGFRPGKVPRSILERYYRAQVEAEVSAKLIEDSYGKAVQENRLAPVAAPNVLDRSFEAGKDFKYTVTVEVKPEIKAEGYKGLSVERPEAKVSEEEVEARLKDLQDSHAQLKPVEPGRPVREKDQVVVDFHGDFEGKPVEGWNVTNHLVEAGSKSLVGGLDQQLIGMSPGEEKETPLTLPEDYPRKELAGKEIRVRLKVKEIKEKILHALDDEFAREVGEFQSLEELKTRIRSSLLEQKQNRANRAAKEKLMDLVRERNPFAVPKSMVERQIDAMVARTEVQLARQGLQLQGTGRDDPKIRESVAPAAEKEVRDSLLLEKIAEIENISVTDDEVEKRLQQLAAQMNQRPEALKSYYEKKGRMEDLRALLLEDKALDFLLAQANVEDRPPASEEASPEKKEEKK
ncbi:MAG TPA: trigger factor [Thermodesulfobacteriota bacterium]|nr:trigger factor [Thermodesulfobacteriota bacterium]